MRLRLSAAALALVLLAAGGAVLLAGRDDRSDLERAMDLLADDTRFATGLEAGDTLARVAQHLGPAIDDCRSDAARSARCSALSAASGYAQVVAARVLRCTAPGRFEARTRVAAYLEEAAMVAVDAVSVPDPPPLPVCAERAASPDPSREARD